MNGNSVRQLQEVRGFDRPLDNFLLRLREAGCDHRASSSDDSRWTAQCPAHDDRHPSLSITEAEDGRVLFNCFAGCDRRDVLAALGLDWPDLFVEARPPVIGTANIRPYAPGI